MNPFAANPCAECLQIIEALVVCLATVGLALVPIADGLYELIVRKAIHK